MKKQIKWSDEENAILTKFWKGNRPGDEVASLLPGRTIYAIKHQVQKLGIATRKPGRVAYLKKSIVDLMKERGPLCSLEMGSMLMCNPRQVDHHIRTMRQKKKVYVAGYVETRNGHLSRLWALGRQSDATYPQKGEYVPVCAIAARPVKKQIIARDPITAALFGRRFSA